MKPFGSLSWIGSCFGYLRKGQTTSRSKRPCRLMVEALEDRAVPATFTVKNLNDAGAGSLRQAILDAEATAAKDRIVFANNLAGNKTVNLTTAGGTQFGPNAFEITTSIDIVGSGQSIARASSAPAFRLFYVSGTGNLRLTNLKLKNGLARGGNGGNGSGGDGGGGGGGGRPGRGHLQQRRRRPPVQLPGARVPRPGRHRRQGRAEHRERRSRRRRWRPGRQRR